jgi:hypothetical protein
VVHCSLGQRKLLLARSEVQAVHAVAVYRVPLGRSSRAHYPQDCSDMCRKATSRILMCRGRESANRTTSATSSGVIMFSSSGMPGRRRPRPIPKLLATPPGQILVHRMPLALSSWSNERVNPT